METIFRLFNPVKKAKLLKRILFSALAGVTDQKGPPQIRQKRAQILRKQRKLQIQSRQIVQKKMEKAGEERAAH